MVEEVTTEHRWGCYPKDKHFADSPIVCQKCFKFLLGNWPKGCTFLTKAECKKSGCESVSGPPDILHPPAEIEEISEKWVCLDTPDDYLAGWGGTCVKCTPGIDCLGKVTYDDKATCLEFCKKRGPKIKWECIHDIGRCIPCDPRGNKNCIYPNQKGCEAECKKPAETECFYVQQDVFVKGSTKCLGAGRCHTTAKVTKKITCGRKPEEKDCNWPAKGSPEGANKNCVGSAPCLVEGQENESTEKVDFNYHYSWVECFDWEVPEGECENTFDVSRKARCMISGKRFNKFLGSGYPNIPKNWNQLQKDTVRRILLDKLSLHSLYIRYILQGPLWAEAQGKALDCLKNNKIFRPEKPKKKPWWSGMPVVGTLGAFGVFGPVPPEDKRKECTCLDSATRSSATGEEDINPVGSKSCLLPCCKEDADPSAPAKKRLGLAKPGPNFLSSRTENDDGSLQAFGGKGGCGTIGDLLIIIDELGKKGCS